MSAASPSGSGIQWAVVDGIASIMIACQLNLLCLEYIVTDPYGKSFGNSLTFLQFLGVTAMSITLLVQRRPGGAWGVRPFILARKYVVGLATLFYFTSVTNNIVFQFGVSVPVHTVFRSSSMIVTMLTGWLTRGQRFTVGQIVCALLVTGGVGGLTVAQRRDTASSSLAASSGDSASVDLVAWCGVGILVLTTVGSAGLGVVQDAMYAELRHRITDEAQRKQVWREALFLSHGLALPYFIGVGLFTGLFDSVMGLPSRLYVPVLLNVVTQFFCVRGVYTLICASSAFVMTLTITMRKFVSLVVSIVVFGHAKAFTSLHYASIAAAMLGASAYPFLPKAPAAAADASAAAKIKKS